MRIEHDTNTLDIMNMVNQKLYEKHLEIQFKIISNDDDEYIEYQLVKTKEIIQY